MLIGNLLQRDIPVHSEFVEYFSQMIVVLHDAGVPFRQFGLFCSVAWI